MSEWQKTNTPMGNEHCKAEDISSSFLPPTFTPQQKLLRHKRSTQEQKSGVKWSNLLISMLCWEVRRLQLQVQETLAAVAFKTPIKFNIYGPPKADMNAPREARGAQLGEKEKETESNVTSPPSQSPVCSLLPSLLSWSRSAVRPSSPRLGSLLLLVSGFSPSSNGYVSANVSVVHLSAAE